MCSRLNDCLYACLRVFCVLVCALVRVRVVLCVFCCVLVCVLVGLHVYVFLCTLAAGPPCLGKTGWWWPERHISPDRVGCVCVCVKKSPHSLPTTGSAGPPRRS